MRSKSAVLAVLLCAVSFGASASSISRISPSVLSLGTAEEFVTIHGTDLQATEYVLVNISGPGGDFIVEPGYVTPSAVIFYAPDAVLLNGGTYTVTVTLKNLEQAPVTIGTLTFSVETIVITGPPLLAIPENVYAPADDAEGAKVFFEVGAISQSGDAVDIDCTKRSGDFFPLGITPVLCSATDVNGTSHGEFEVWVADITPPVLTLPDDFESDSPVVTYTVSAVDNVDGPVDVHCSRASGSTFPTGVVSVFCETYDSYLNHASGTFKVTVHGGVPVLTVPDDMTIDATSAAGAAVTYSATASEGGVVTCSPASGSTFPLGITIVNCSATNAVGTVTASFTIEVVDATGPVLTLPDDKVVEATGPDGAVVTYTASAVDAIDGVVPVTCDPASGTNFALGVTEVTCTASDLQGHETVGTFTITVQDTTPPEIVSVSVTPETLWPPDHKMYPVTVSIIAIDAVDPSPVSRIVSVKSNQPLNGTGDGDTSPDWSITGPLSVNLRSERAGSADRIYTITIETTDASGNVTETEVTVKVTQGSRRRSVR